MRRPVTGCRTRLAAVLPTGQSLLSLLALTVIAAVLANLINNLPATLVLLAALGANPAAGAVLAILIGVNVGPNLTYTGSLATLLWRRVLHAKGHRPSLGRFTLLGLLTVPGCLLFGTLALWVGLLRVIVTDMSRFRTSRDAAGRSPRRPGSG